MDAKPKTAVLYGGNSSEREVSLRSGSAVSQALRSRGYDIVEIDVRDDFRRSLETADVKVAFIALHGSFGEDGQIQRILDRAGIAYTGSGAKASRIGMNKPATKRLLIRNGVPTPKWVLLAPDDGERNLSSAIETLGSPIVVKPPADGSSIGLFLAQDAQQLAEAVQEARKHAGSVMLEQFVAGRELTVGILNGVVLPIIEIICDGLFDYQSKYTEGRTQYDLSPKLDDGVVIRVNKAALATYTCIGCSGAARVDIRLDGSGVPFVLEINTIPGLTATSLVPKAAKAASIDFPELCEMMILDAIGRHRFNAAGGSFGKSKATA